MDDIVGELRDCAADSAEVGYKSRAQVAMLRAADDIVALQGRIVRQCQSVNELVAATEKCIEERAALRARVAELETALARQRQYEYVQAQHEETGRDWFGARYNIPERFHEVSNESGVPGPTARLPGSDTGSRE